MFVYIIKCRRAVKIGISDDPHFRCESLQIGNPFPLSLVWTVEVADIAAPAIERAAHRALHLRELSNEWFAVGVPVAKRAIKAAVANYRPPARHPAMGIDFETAVRLTELAGERGLVIANMTAAKAFYARMIREGVM